MRRCMENPARSATGGVRCFAHRLNTPEHRRNRRDLQCSARLDSPRLERMVERVHALGPRPLGEMLAEIAHRTGQHVRVVDLVEEYAQLDPDLLRFLGGDSFAPMPLEVVR